MFVDNSCFGTSGVNKLLYIRFQLVLTPITWDSDVRAFHVIKLHYFIHCTTHISLYLFKSPYVFRRKSIQVLSILPRTTSTAEEVEEVNYIMFTPHFFPESEWWKSSDYSNVWMKMPISSPKPISLFVAVLNQFQVYIETHLCLSSQSVHVHSSVIWRTSSKFHSLAYMLCDLQFIFTHVSSTLKSGLVFHCVNRVINGLMEQQHETCCMREKDCFQCYYCQNLFLVVYSMGKYAYSIPKCWQCCKA